MRRRIKIKGLISRTNPDGNTSYISPEVALHKKLQKGIITEEELHIYVELTHVENKKRNNIMLIVLVMIQAILLRYNLPAKVLPIQQIESINSQSEFLISVNLIGGDRILGYHIKFEIQ